MTLRPLLSALFCLGLVFPAGAGEQPNPMQPSEIWESLKPDVIGDREILDGGGLLTLDAPYRAHDAAIVPVTVTENPDAGKDFTKLTLVIDENPSPVVATFEIGPAMGDIALETRVRINAYSNVRALAETADGEVYMVGRFVKASGGCAAPANKDPEAAMANLGAMKLRLFDASAQALTPGAERPEAQVMLRHPNYSGLQRNQITHLFIPAHFVDQITVTLGEELVFSMTGGISISEDPSFRFAYDPNGADAFSVEASDTEGNSFAQSFPVEGRES